MRILLATDGHSDSAGAARMAGVLAREEGADVMVIRALEPIPVYGPASTHMLWFPEPMPNEEWKAAAADEVRELLRNSPEVPDDWPVHVEVGPIATTIAREAAREGADLLLLGSGRHDRIDRWFGTETALRVMQLSTVPVLAVPAGGGTRPRIALVAVDFSGFSRDAVAAALGVIAPGARLHLVHVLPNPQDFTTFYGVEWTEDYHTRVREQLGEWAESLGLPPDVQVESHVRDGTVAPAILDLAGEVGAELLVAGSHGMGFVGRLVLGSVSTRLLRRADCAVLISPPRDDTPDLDAGDH